MIRLSATSQRVGDGELVGRVVGRGSKGIVAILFWATGSTGATTLSGSSTGAVGWRDEGPLDGGRGAEVRDCLETTTFPHVLDGEVADGTAGGGLAIGFAPPPPRTAPDSPGWAGGDTKDGTTADS